MVVYKSQNSRYRKDLLFLDTTDRVPACTGAAVVHTDTAAVEEEEIGMGAVRSGRPVVAVVASIAGSAAAKREFNCLL